MKKTAIVGLLVVALGGVPSPAQGQGWYLGSELGGHVVQALGIEGLSNDRKGESRGGAGAYQKGEKTFRPGMKGLGGGNGITPTVFTMFFHKNDYWDSHRRTRNRPAHGIA